MWVGRQAGSHTGPIAVETTGVKKKGLAKAVQTQPRALGTTFKSYTKDQRC